MKQLTCRELGGACDVLITGASPEQMGEHSKQHAMAMVQLGDAAHIEAMEKMRALSPEEFQAFWADFLKKFEEADKV